METIYNLAQKSWCNNKIKKSEYWARAVALVLVLWHKILACLSSHADILHLTTISLSALPKHRRKSASQEKGSLRSPSKKRYCFQRSEFYCFEKDFRISFLHLSSFVPKVFVFSCRRLFMAHCLYAQTSFLTAKGLFLRREATFSFGVRRGRTCSSCRQWMGWTREQSSRKSIAATD